MYSTLLTESDRAAFRTVLIASQLRGDHSTGIATVSLKKKKKFRWDSYRALGDSSKFLKDPEVDKLLKRPNSYAILGHTRFTTSGHTTIYNAHPINEKHITGCHNGVIPELDPKPGEDKERVTDSRKFFRIIAEEGLEKAIEAAKYGSFAITYVDKSTRTLNIIRDNGRPLFLTNDKNHTTYLWASEAGFLRLALDRCHLWDWAEPYSIEPYHLYTWHIGSPKFEVTKIKKPELIYTPYVYRSSSSVPSVGSSGGRINHATYSIDPWDDELNEDWGVYPLEPVKNLSRFQRYGGEEFCTQCWEERKDCKCEENGEDNSEPLYVWYAGQKSPVSTMKYLLDEGCFSCQRQFRPEDKVYWPHYEYYLCDECYNTEFMREAMRHTTVYLGCILEGDQ